MALPAPAPLRVLLLGAGGREHALAAHLLASPRVQHVYVAPGNGGTAMPPRASNVDVPATPADGFAAIVQWAVQQQVSAVARRRRRRLQRAGVTGSRLRGNSRARSQREGTPLQHSQAEQLGGT
jgi:hypothetical protein